MRLTFADLPRAERAALTREYGRLYGDARARMLTEVIQRWGLTISSATLAREIRRERQFTRAPQPSLEAPPLAPVGLPAGAALWNEWRATAEHENRAITVMHACDVHAPFHDPRAVGLFCQIAERAQPDVIILGSDYFDFYISSSFSHENAGYNDELDCAEAHWRPFVDQLAAAAPNAQRVFIWGNHERRLVRYLSENAPAYQARLMRDFVSIVEAGGRVWYAGECDHVQIGYLRIEHGVRHGENAARQRLLDLGGQANVMAGHAHRFSQFSQRGARYAVSGIVSGCLSQPEPHYLPTGQTSMSGRAWQQGTVVATALANEPDCAFEPVVFTRSADNTTCWFRGTRLTA